MSISELSNRGREHNVWKGLVAGTAAGLAGSLAMDMFQALWSKLSGDEKKSAGAHSPRQDGSRITHPQKEPREEDEETPATVKVASAISENVFDRQLSSGEKKVAGQAVHYAFGTATGALYGMVAEFAPGASAGAGLAFGAAVWLLADEATVPALGLSKPPAEYPISTHAYSLASHFVYGLSAEMVRRAVRNAL